MKVGVYLGVSPGAGGMFQYAQAILDSLGTGAPDDWQLCAAYLSPDWLPILERYPRFAAKRVRAPGFAARWSAGLMAARVPPAVCRAFAWINPAAHALSSFGSDVWLFPGQDALSFQTGERAVVTIHDLMHRYEPQYPEVSKSGRYAIREHRFSSIARTAEKILVDSEIGKAQVVESYGAEAGKIECLPYIPPAYIYDNSVPRDFKEKYPLPPKFLFYPAQFWAHKNHRNLLLALASLHSDGVAAHVVLSGGKAHGYADIAQLARDLGLEQSVTFVGYVPDEYLRGFYEAARGLVYPTAFGPTNIPPLEALVCGCPVAASGIYGMKEQLGEAALFFDPSDVQDIAKAMHQLWADDRLCAHLRSKGDEQTLLWGRAQFRARLVAVLEGIGSSSRRQ